MRTYFRREAKKIHTLKSGSACIDFLPRWEHFSRLSFLNDVFLPCESITNLNVSVEDSSNLNLSQIEEFQTQLSDVDDDGGMVAENEGAAAAEGASAIVDEYLPSSGPPRKRRKVNNDATNALASANKCLNILNSEIQKPPSMEEHFSGYVAGILDSIVDPVDRELCRIDLIKVLMRYKFKNREIYV